MIQYVMQISSFIFWLLVIPFCIGLIPANFISAEKRSPGFVLLSGYFGMWALFELSAVPAVLWVEYDNFKTASAVFTVLALLGAAAGTALLYRNMKAGKPGLVAGKSRMVKGDSRKAWKNRTKDSAGDWNRKSDTNVGNSDHLRIRPADTVKRLLAGTGVEWLIFFALLGFQLYKAVAYASFDGDDAYYVVESLIAQEAGVMYRILPLTGGSTGLDVRHAMAVFPMWVAYVAVRAGVHATIVSHVVIPLAMIPLTYLLYFEIGRVIFLRNSQGSGRKSDAGKTASADEKQAVAGGVPATDGNVFGRENLPIFMIIMAVFQIFGNVSIYTSETFFLTRTWQGKAVAGALVIPALFWVFLQISAGNEPSDSETGIWRMPRESKMSPTETFLDDDKGVRNRRTDAGLWILLVCINMTAGVCSSIAVFLVCLLIAVAAFILAVAERDWKFLFKAGAACIPSVVYMAVYVIMAYSYMLL